jgi:glycine/D-amino acid oxidase-like deaminating enzyme
MSEVTWQEEVDLLVLGTGAAGLAAAVTGANEGLSVLALEKTEFVGGTTAYSAGTCWIPGNRYQQADGVTDDVPEASRYLDALVGDRAPRELREAYLARGGEMVEYLDRVGVRFWHSKKVVDYHPEIPGSARGRALEPQTFDGRTLGTEGFGRIRPPVPEFALFGGTLMVRRPEVNELLGIFEGSVLDGTGRGVLTALRLGVRWAADRLRYPRGTRLAMGNALVANLFHRLRERGGRVWFTATATRLLTEEGRVVGAVVAHQGRESGPGAGWCWRAAASRRARTGGRATCRPRRRSTPARPRARPATRWRSPRPSAARSVSPATTTPSGSPAPSAAAATARPRCSRTSGTGPSRASSRSTRPAGGSSTSRCPTTGSPARCTTRTSPRPPSRPGW